MYQSIKLSIYSIPKILTIPTEKRLLPFFPLINQTNIKNICLPFFAEREQRQINFNYNQRKILSKK